jgi:hypothetical protein
MITDVNDNSSETTNKLIQEMSESGINTTIIGISDDFNSKLCEDLIQIKGFNYFCAIEDSDLMQYLVNKFDYTFFVSSLDK